MAYVEVARLSITVANPTVVPPVKTTSKLPLIAGGIGAAGLILLAIARKRK